LLFVLFSTPFWHAGGSALSDSPLSFLVKRHTLYMLREGLQLELNSQLRWVLPSTCAFVRWEELDASAALDELQGVKEPLLTDDARGPPWAAAVQVRSTFEVDGAPAGGELQVHQGALTHRWGQTFSLSELRYIHRLLLAWGQLLQAGDEWRIPV